MRAIRWLVVGAFLIAVGLYAAVRYQAWQRQDAHSPIISVQPEVLSLSVNEVSSRLMEGVSAWDEEEGDLTGQIIVGDFSALSGENSCYLTYVVFDKANHSTSYRRKIQFEDYHAPCFQLVSPLVFSIGSGTSTRSYVRAFDVLDGELTEDMVELENSVNFAQPGEYTIQVQVTNSLDDSSELKLPVHILEQGQTTLDNACPLLYVEKGSPWGSEDYLWAVTGEEHQEIQVEDHVDPETPGVYQIHFYTGTEHTWTTVVVYE